MSLPVLERSPVVIVLWGLWAGLGILVIGRLVARGAGRDEINLTTSGLVVHRRRWLYRRSRQLPWNRIVAAAVTADGRTVMVRTRTGYWSVSSLGTRDQRARLTAALRSQVATVSGVTELPVPAGWFVEPAAVAADAAPAVAAPADAASADAASADGAGDGVPGPAGLLVRQVPRRPGRRPARSGRALLVDVDRLVLGRVGSVGCRWSAPPDRVTGLEITVHRWGIGGDRCRLTAVLGSGRRRVLGWGDAAAVRDFGAWLAFHSQVRLVDHRHLPPAAATITVPSLQDESRADREN